jgi:ribosome maturation factor RimP
MEQQNEHTDHDGREYAGGDLESRIRAMAEDIAAGLGLFIVDVQVRGRQGSRTVEVFADTDQGIMPDQLASLSRKLGFLLETDEVIVGKYTLDVSSPGAARPLTMPRQFPRHVGRDLKVVLSDGDQEITGRLTGVDDTGIQLDVAGEPRHVAFEEIATAHVQLPW